MSKPLLLLLSVKLLHTDLVSVATEVILYVKTVRIQKVVKKKVFSREVLRFDRDENKTTGYGPKTHPRNKNHSSIRRKDGS